MNREKKDDENFKAYIVYGIENKVTDDQMKSYLFLFLVAATPACFVGGFSIGMTIMSFVLLIIEIVTIATCIIHGYMWEGRSFLYFGVNSVNLSLLFFIDNIRVLLLISNRDTRIFLIIGETLFYLIVEFFCFYLINKKIKEGMYKNNKNNSGIGLGGIAAILSGPVGIAIGRVFLPGKEEDTIFIMFSVCLLFFIDNIRVLLLLSNKEVK